MATDTSTKLLHAFITKAAIQTAREQCPEKNWDQMAVEDARKIAESTINELSQIIHNIKDEGKTGEDAVAHLPTERITKIRKALEMKTFRININEKERKAEITRNGQDMYPAITIDSPLKLEKVDKLQQASIAVEAVILVLELIGLTVPDLNDKTKAVMELVVTVLERSNTLLEDIEKIRKDKDNYKAMAKDIFVLIIDMFHDGIFWQIVKALFVDMSDYERAMAFVKITAFIAVLICTGGILYIAMLVSKIVKAADFLKKLANLGTLRTMKMSLMTS